MFVWQNELQADFGSVYKSIVTLNVAFPERFPIALENKRNPAAIAAAAAAAAVLALEGSFSVFKQTAITLMPDWQEEKHN